MKFHEATLDNGLTIVAELNPQAHSLAAGYFVRTGSRDETSGVSGVSHFLEHMAFKGNEKYSADDVNRIFDEIGARYNASTSEEVTLYYAAVLPEYIEQTIELLSTLIRPTLRQDDFDMEKKVILEEISMYEDQPGFSAYEKSMSAHFADHPLGQSILGSAASIGALTSEQMSQYHAEHYQAGNITLAVAGNADWDELRRLTDKYCAAWPAGKWNRPTTEAQPTGSTNYVTRESNQQQHMMQLSPAPAAADSLRFAAELLSVIVGDDSGSRLYWELVDPGLVEAAELGYNEYDGSGTYLTYLSCDPESAAENIERIAAIYDDVNKNGVTDVEVEQSRNKVASRVVLRSERPMGRLSSLGSNWVYRQEHQTVEDDLKILESLSAKSIRELLEAYPLGQMTTVGIGPLEAPAASA
ncbi:MAG: insulinase family protein [Planctomycetaceae bacterium]|nr:insulinase family protein [Planctomycetaceae bacterium]MBT6155940.1 insulinase family protein [Planctomycetaceae bacterium]MBT6483145.1 insulinase family protein [Planctomycetaceae bacterium]MBT6497747.1 insulinase family protein [Planctomycetaceae bacterium]